MEGMTLKAGNPAFGSDDGMTRARVSDLGVKRAMDAASAPDSSLASLAQTDLHQQLRRRSRPLVCRCIVAEHRCLFDQTLSELSPR